MHIWKVKCEYQLICTPLSGQFTNSRTFRYPSRPWLIWINWLGKPQLFFRYLVWGLLGGGTPGWLIHQWAGGSSVTTCCLSSLQFLGNSESQNLCYGCRSEHCQNMSCLIKVKVSFFAEELCIAKFMQNENSDLAFQYEIYSSTWIS